ncbi:uncharacterized protein LOC131945931 [Physella acuta]|uniref:uncharacterized protein LOC131945931 n=1 Tax=Physella acuta TaxID=109671 RepID=UPI0027DE83C1|nr:uncharacterized protein LOC131945931 [Physella acuta]
MVWSDLQTYGRRVGLSDPYLLYAADTFQFEQDTFRQELRGVNYVCAVYRLIKLVPTTPDHSAIVTYNGEYVESGQVLKWDVDLVFKKGELVQIDGYLAETLRRTKYSKYFSFDTCDRPINTARNQNPFQYLSKLRADGRDYPKAIYPMDEKINKFYEDIIGKIF